MKQINTSKTAIAHGVNNNAGFRGRKERKIGKKKSMKEASK